ncbi:hypothetical protein IV203_035828 [Nitzschia inconspicua]|uniref:Uncharacterized protein n=1 Tax=Nitzschia inconspicua TaxID=303405 RepID=A0A9K3LFD2_9STRA|nr:hypothetical protein IV203_035828 [Nitzschia inconspicua]
MTQDPMKSIPADLKAFQDGWEERTDDSHPYEIVMEDDFTQDYSAKRMCDILGYIAQRLTSLIAQKGKTVNRAAVLDHLLDTAVTYKLEEYTTQVLVRLNHPPLAPYEFREFLFTRWLRSRFKVSNEVAFASLMKHVASDKIVLIERDCFIAIQSCTPNGFIGLDDELIASRAADVEQKVVSNQKRGKEGPVADCIACSMLSMCCGMRLHVKDDSSNVNRLLDSLLTPNNSKCGIELAFDRGYGKLTAVLAAAKRDLDVITIAGTLGSRHPYNTVEEWDAAMQRRRNRSQITPEMIRDLKSICRQWIIPNDNYLGCEVRVAKRQQPQSKTVYALALRDVFNRKEAMKDLKFFVTQNHKPYTFVGVPKGQQNRNNVLFSNATASATRTLVEGMILQSAEPLTSRQRCADWFLMKSMVISGTMAGKISQTVNLNTLRMSNEGLSNLLRDCIASWFGRHKGMAMMAAGSRNEEPTIEKLLSSVKFIKVIYDVGLLRWRNNRCIGVLPDAVCLISVVGKTDPVPCCLEIKTRLADTTVRTAESSATKHGSVVNCVFGDDTFKDCVPAENRAQVLHQALVTQFDYGLFVTSKVQGGEGSLVQVVVIEIPSYVRMTHGLVLCAAATPLLGFLHGEHVDAQLQEEEKDHDEGELEEEDQEDKQKGGKTDEQDIEEEEIEELYYDDVYFPSDIDSLEDSTQEEEEDSE